jgi:hypothetical protein
VPGGARRQGGAADRLQQVPHPGFGQLQILVEAPLELGGRQRGTWIPPAGGLEGLEQGLAAGLAGHPPGPPGAGGSGLVLPFPGQPLRQPGLGPLAAGPGTSVPDPLGQGGEGEVQQHGQGQLVTGWFGKAGEDGVDGQGAPLRTGIQAALPRLPIQAGHEPLQPAEQGVPVPGRPGVLGPHEGLELPRAAVLGPPMAGHLGQAALDPRPLVRAEPGRQFPLEQAHGTVQPKPGQSGAGVRPQEAAAQQHQDNDGKAAQADLRKKIPSVYVLPPILQLND